MEKLDEYIRDVNLFSTNTIKMDDLYKPYPKKDSVEINYENSISLFHLVSSFNSLYVSFMEEYEKLPKLDLGKDVEHCYFYHVKTTDNDIRSLLLYIDEPTIVKESFTYLELNETNNIIENRITNCLQPFEEGYYLEEIKLDNNIVKGYLDLFEKYELLFDTFYTIRNHQLFGNGYSSIFTHIDKTDCNLLDGLNKIEISIYSKNEKDYTNIFMNLGKDFDIDLDKCKMELNRKPVEATKEDYSKVLNSIYLDQEYTKLRK